MKKLLAVLTAMITIGTSQANQSINQHGNEIYGNPITIVSSARTAIKKEPDLAKLSKLKRPKLFVGHPRKNVTFAVDDDYDSVDLTDDIITSYRRRDLQKIYNVPDNDHDRELNYYVRFRLMLARKHALEKYREIYG